MPPRLKGLSRPKMTEDEQKLRDLWNAPRLDDKGIPESPSMFRGEPNIVGSDLARAAHELFGIAPNLRNRIKNIQYGPNTGVLELMDRDGSTDYGTTPVLGLTSTDRTGRSNISLNPELASGRMMLPTLAHELTHAAGIKSEEEPIKAGSMMYRRRNR